MKPRTRPRKIVMQKRLLSVPLILLLFGLSGCMTPQEMRDRRITNAWPVFSTFAPEIQNQIRQGHVDIGFTKEMVRLALSSPSRIYSRKTEDGLSTVWSYSGWIPSSRYEPVTVSTWIQGECGRVQPASETVWVTVDDSREYERIRVEFKKEQVLAIEWLQP